MSQRHPLSVIISCLVASPLLAGGVRQLEHSFDLELNQYSDSVEFLHRNIVPDGSQWVAEVWKDPSCAIAGDDGPRRVVEVVLRDQEQRDVTHRFDIYCAALPGGDALLGVVQLVQGMDPIEGIFIYRRSADSGHMELVSTFPEPFTFGYDGLYLLARDNRLRATVLTYRDKLGGWNTAVHYSGEKRTERYALDQLATVTNADELLLLVEHEKTWETVYRALEIGAMTEELARWEVAKEAGEDTAAKALDSNEVRQRFNELVVARQGAPTGDASLQTGSSSQ
jgi:hypothetical protein